MKSTRSLRAYQDDDLSELSRSELVEMVVALRSENANLRRTMRSAVKDTPPFDIMEACAFAGYAFESYNAPQGARWERGADGCDVAFSSASFVRECYAGAIVVRAVEVNGLRDQRDLSEVALTGGKSDPYVTMAVVEVADGSLMERAGNATDVARTTTIWRGGSRAKWPANESYTLFVRDVSLARLALTVMDEDMGEDDVLGAAELKLSQVIRSTTKQSTWRGSLQLRADSESKVLDPGAGLAGAAAAAMVGVATAGVAMVAVAAAAAAAAANERRGSLEVEVTYYPFTTNADVVSLAPSLSIEPKIDRPKGATPGLDWSTSFPVSYGDYEPLCFVDHRFTGTQAGVWRDAQRRSLLVAFRGTSEPRDIVTDASAAMTPWARDARRDVDGYESVPSAAGEPRVHAGFRGALDSIARRLKQLLVVAASQPDEKKWLLELTGHSLGGALATLFALDAADGINPYRALPLRPPVGKSWFLDVLTGAPSVSPNTPLISTEYVKLVTFGAPRTGDLAFARALETKVNAHFRVVNGQDIVARLPRGFAYVHAGRTVLVDDDPEATAALWVEGIDDGECPLKLTDSARSNRLVSSPFSKGGPFADVLDRALEQSPSSNGNSAVWNPFGTTIDTAVRFRDLAVDAIAAARTPAQIAALAGVDPEYAELELKLLTALSSGDAINHHLEPAYFDALMRAAGRVPLSRILEPGADSTRYDPDETLLET